MQAPNKFIWLEASHIPLLIARHWMTVLAKLDRGVKYEAVACETKPRKSHRFNDADDDDVAFPAHRTSCFRVSSNHSSHWISSTSAANTIDRRCSDGREQHLRCPKRNRSRVFALTHRWRWHDTKRNKIFDLHTHLRPWCGRHLNHINRRVWITLVTETI